MENMELGLTLMAIGMITVFAILLIVINLSKMLIAIVNKVAPEETAPVKKATPKAPAIDGNVMAIIQAAVTSVTGGKGTVSKVEKL